MDGRIFDAKLHVQLGTPHRQRMQNPSRFTCKKILASSSVWQPFPFCFLCRFFLSFFVATGKRPSSTCLVSIHNFLQKTNIFQKYNIHHEVFCWSYHLDGRHHYGRSIRFRSFQGQRSFVFSFEHRHPLRDIHFHQE